MPKAEGGLAFEIANLQNTIKLKSQELDAVRKDVTALKSALNTAQRLLEQRAAEADRNKERTLRAEGTAAAQAAEVAQLRTDKRKLESNFSSLQRQHDKLQERLAAAGNKGPAFSDQVASLQSEVRQLKQASQEMSENHKAAVATIRAKDKQLELDQEKLKVAAATEDRMHELEGELAGAKKVLEQTQAEMRTLTQVVRARDADIASLNKSLDTTTSTLEATRQDLSTAQASLKAAEAAAAELTSELNVTKDELIRTKAVAGRAAAADAQLVKAEGVVPAGQHLEEVKFLNGTIARLKDKLAAAEREAAVAHTIKERYRSALETANVSISADLEAPPAIMMRRLSTSSARRSSCGVARSVTRATDVVATEAAAAAAASQAEPTNEADAAQADMTAAAQQGLAALSITSAPNQQSHQSDCTIAGEGSMLETGEDLKISQDSEEPAAAPNKGTHKGGKRGRKKAGVTEVKAADGQGSLMAAADTEAPRDAAAAAAQTEPAVTATQPAKAVSGGRKAARKAPATSMAAADADGTCDVSIEFKAAEVAAGTENQQPPRRTTRRTRAACNQSDDL